MTETEFMERFALECKVRSRMTFQFSRKEYRKFKLFFIRKGRLHFKWNVTKSTKEFNAMCKAFKIIIK
tara:strand:+ start:1821 stop:2024 length:204 start_codon:yes stop_codon:yes gene_type:complete